jgi:hypothetical protein
MASLKLGIGKRGLRDALSISTMISVNGPAGGIRAFESSNP